MASTTTSGDRHRAQAIAAAALRQATALGITLPPTLRLWSLAADFGGRSVDPVRSVGAGEDGLASVLEAVTPAEQRQVNGLHVTPSWLADELVGLALDELSIPPDALTICDPACGGGAFLLAAARALHGRGVPRRDVVRRLLWGADVDPVGLAAAEVELALWAGEAPPADHLVVGDPLLAGRALWPTGPAAGFAAVVGNPPFLNQLGRATVRPAETSRRLRERFGRAVRAYTDTAWLFLLLGCELVRDGGRVTLLQPISLVGARDAAVVRATLGGQATLRHLWVEQERSFAAHVNVCAPVLEVRHPTDSTITADDSAGPAATDTTGSTAAATDAAGPAETTASGDAAGSVARESGDAIPRPGANERAVMAPARSRGRAGARRPGEGGAGAVGGGVGGRRQGQSGAASAADGRDGRAWADRLADGLGIPRVDVAGGQRLGDRAEVMAGFRDEYYGLIPLVREALGVGDERPLVTAGVIDWGRSGWGERPTRFAKRRWTAPVVDLSRLDGGDHPRSGDQNHDVTEGARADDPRAKDTGAKEAGAEAAGAKAAGAEDGGAKEASANGGGATDPIAKDTAAREAGAGSGGGKDARELARDAARWVERTAVAKIVVATQTRVVEAAVDEEGRWVPSVPTLAILPYDPDDLWPLAAALSSPTATAWLLRRAPETGMSRGALKIAARDLAELPLPTDHNVWQAATAAFQAYVQIPTPARLDAFAQPAAAAYHAPPSLTTWWRRRLPPAGGA